MGGCSSDNSSNQERLGSSNLSISLFKVHKAIGWGGFGRVWRANLKASRQQFAIKIMSKAKVLTKKSVRSVMNQKQILSRLYHPFIINLHMAFQDRENLYLVLDLLTGADLRHFINIRTQFTQPMIKFIMACIVLSLEYIHFNSIIHRDIKPQNLVFNGDGYLKLTDFGIANIWKPQNSVQNSGTPGYMAPEVICHQNHSFSVDYFAMGVIAYQLAVGYRPYLGSSRKQIRDSIIARQVQITPSTRTKVPVSAEFIDLVNKLLQRKPVNRLGHNGISQIKQHSFFNNFDWSKLLKLKSQSSCKLKPRVELLSYMKEEQKSVIQLQNQLLLKRKQVQDLFHGYQFEGRNTAATEESRSQSMINISFQKERLAYT